ncbi:MAG: D-aminoacyl-tRNA deacylase [candidate division KSB1 bacterium]|nr:D-aminoacyl-tRNA deacylase [candidate division KSB1 bacterium]MDZ7288163.1 D-aminoacyl-tRNA deacylase [candidate division KSB1 bacterium]MDZ7300324.1 D-aminoacyl-tRNA deacylase [candidate division KSB1 bacterium]MDZ7308670.1 D-aminoacyl-tRNA deacylase [candidate division KSB1 bacterium]MDZ7351324.1 D-aminoacyl-tRNA deacylase [candidate division KSB1 bacterium]
MRALLQRVKKGSVKVNGRVVGAIEQGLVILLGVARNDTIADAVYLADKCVNLRIFEDENSHFNHSLLETGGGVLVVSQFTLYGDTRKGRRPGFEEAARPEQAEPLYRAFIQELQRHGLTVAEGVFGAMMLVEIHNDGPVTFLVESKPKNDKSSAA